MCNIFNKMDVFNSVKCVYDTVKSNIITNKNDLLDPLSVIIKLNILNYKPVGTKISIQNNKICLQDNTYVQGTIRSIYGDKKNDLNMLYGPIIYACVFYLSPSNRDKYLKLFQSASSGLAKLKETYTGKDIIYNIEQIINIVDTFINKEDSDPAIFVSNYNSPVYKMKNDIYKHISSVWNDKRINLILTLIEEIETSPEASTISLLYTINYYLDHIDHKVNELTSNI